MPLDIFRFLNGGGQIAELIRTFPRDRTTVGSIASWPEVPRTTLGAIRRSLVAIRTHGLSEDQLAKIIAKEVGLLQGARDHQLRVHDGVAPPRRRVARSISNA